ncbi:MAG: hypothetical protein AAGA65_30215 [Actinomycetota bacterium]
MSGPNERPELPDTWIEAANEADYAFFEVTEPAPTYRWAGGYGYSHEGPVVLEILAVVRGEEVSVETVKAGEAAPPDLRQWFLLQDLVRTVLDPDTERLDFPLTLTFDEDDWTISVDGEPRVFRGYSVNGRAWQGATTLPDGREIIIKDPAGARPTALATCHNWAMTDTGPR